MGSDSNSVAGDYRFAADSDEPVFVLHGRDAYAADLVRLWALLRGRMGGSRNEVAEAFAQADVMAAWGFEQSNGYVGCGEVRQNLYIAATTGMAAHPEGFECPCNCDDCRSYS
jgi:hypothetical protein